MLFVYLLLEMSCPIAILTACLVQQSKGGVMTPKETLKKGCRAPKEGPKSLIFLGTESPFWNFSDGVSRFRRSWLEVEVAILHTDDGNEVRAGRSQTSKEEELS
jgi:hypothetical protein